MFNLLRHFAIRSFLGVLVAALLLATFYRHIEIQEATEFARKSNLTLAELVLDSIRPELGEYLESAANLGSQEIRQAPFPSALAAAITESMGKASIAKVRIYNQRGVIVFSSAQRELGNVDATNPAFLLARAGESGSEISYNDAFSFFTPRLDDDNVVRTFVPARSSSAHAVRGALAIYVDLSPSVAQNEREVLTVTTGIALILILLYAALLFIIVRAKKVIDAQQYTIRERTETLETVSLQLLASDEAQKLNLAFNLHEGLAQSLTAVKVGIEQGLERTLPAVTRDESLNTALAALQGAIEEVQEMAAELRPPSLDELGLLPTIRWYCREFEYLHPDIQIEQQISVQEQEIPEQLKIVIYRIIEAVFKDIGNDSRKDRIRLSLQPSAKAIVLAIEDIPQQSPSAATAPDSDQPRLRFAAAQERATLSGGAFTAAFNREGGITLNASWSM